MHSPSLPLAASAQNRRRAARHQAVKEGGAALRKHVVAMPPA